MDGMGEMDNAPLPPESADDSMPPMDDSNEPPMDGANDAPDGGMNDNDGEGFNDDNGVPPSDDGMNDNDDEMGGMPPQDEGDNDDSELMDIFNNLSIEDKAAVAKYAKSMMDDSGGDEGMTQESRRNIRDLIDETFNDIVNGGKERKRDKKELPKQYRKMNNPFKSPYA